MRPVAIVVAADGVVPSYTLSISTLLVNCIFVTSRSRSHPLSSNRCAAVGSWAGRTTRSGILRFSAMIFALVARS